MSSSSSSGTAKPCAAGIASSSGLCLPVRGSLTLACASSLLIALLMAFASLAGLRYGTALYQTEEMLLQKLPTDLFTLVVALPLLLVSIWLARRGRLLGLLCWPGVLLYVVYVYLAYTIGVPLGILFPVYLLLVALGTYTLIGLVASIDAAAVRQRLAGAVPAKVAGGILTALAILFTLINLAEILPALTSPAPEHLLVYPVWISDLIVLAPAWLIGGWLLWRQRSLGYVAGAGLLLVGSLLFLGAIFALIFPALTTASPVDLMAVLFMLATGLICFLPFALFARGILRSGTETSQQ